MPACSIAERYPRSASRRPRPLPIDAEPAGSFFPPVGLRHIKRLCSHHPALCLGGTGHNFGVPQRLKRLCFSCGSGVKINMRATACWSARRGARAAATAARPAYDDHGRTKINNPNLGKNGEIQIEATPSARTGLPIGTGELGSMAFEGDYVVHYERGVARYAGRVQGEHDSSSSEPPILLRFADKTVALEHAEAARLTRLRGSDEVVDLGGPVKSEVATPTLSKARVPPSQKPPTLSKWARPDVWHRKRDRAEAASRDHAGIAHRWRPLEVQGAPAARSLTARMKPTR